MHATFIPFHCCGHMYIHTCMSIFCPGHQLAKYMDWKMHNCTALKPLRTRCYNFLPVWVRGNCIDIICSNLQIQSNRKEEFIIYIQTLTFLYVWSMSWLSKYLLNQIIRSFQETSLLCTVYTQPPARSCTRSMNINFIMIIQLMHCSARIWDQKTSCCCPISSQFAFGSLHSSDEHVGLIIYHIHCSRSENTQSYNSCKAELQACYQPADNKLKA